MERLLSLLALADTATTLVAAPVVVGNEACPNYAVDIESFASCDGDRVAMPAALQLTSVMLLAELATPLATETIVMLMCRSGEGSTRAADELALRGYAHVVSVTHGFEGDVGPDGRRALNGWKNAGLPWTARVDAALIAGAR